MGFLQGLNDAKSFSKHGFPSVGKYTCKVRTVKYKTDTFKGVPAYIVEYDIVKSTSETDPVGVTRAWVQTMAPKDRALSGIKQFIHAVGKAETETEKAGINAEEVAEAAVLEPCPLKNATFNLEVRPYTTKEGKATTITVFSPDR